MEENVEIQLRKAILKEIGGLCEEWVLHKRNHGADVRKLIERVQQNTPTQQDGPAAYSMDEDDDENLVFEYNQLPFWFQTQLNEHTVQFSRTKFSKSKAIATVVPDIEFLSPIDGIAKPTTSSSNSSSQNANMVEDTKCEAKVSLSGWDFLQTLESQADDLTQSRRMFTTSEDSREDAKTLVIQVLDAIMKVGHGFGLRIVFTEIDLSYTNCSMRALFGGTDGTGKAITREKEVQVLDLSYSQTSSRSLKNFCKAVDMKALKLDHCMAVKRTKEKQFSNVFSQLLEHKIPALEELSVVGTSELLGNQWINQVEIGCPKLKMLYFTRKSGEKALGWDDIILMQSMRDPHLLPCGHIGDYATLRGLRHLECSLDRTPFRLSDLVPLKPHITRLIRDPERNTGWAAEIVDHAREVLDDKALYHLDCGEFYNFNTLKDIYKINASAISNETIAALANRHCCSCRHQFSRENLRICFPKSAKLDTQDTSFDTLEKLNMYSFQ